MLTRLRWRLSRAVVLATVSLRSSVGAGYRVRLALSVSAPDIRLALQSRWRCDRGARLRGGLITPPRDVPAILT